MIIALGGADAAVRAAQRYGVFRTTDNDQQTDAAFTRAIKRALLALGRQPRGELHFAHGARLSAAAWVLDQHCEQPLGFVAAVVSAYPGAAVMAASPGAVTLRDYDATRRLVVEFDVVAVSVDGTLWSRPPAIDARRVFQANTVQWRRPARLSAAEVSLRRFGLDRAALASFRALFARARVASVDPAGLVLVGPLDEHVKVPVATLWSGDGAALADRLGLATSAEPRAPSAGSAPPRRRRLEL